VTDLLTPTRGTQAIYGVNPVAKLAAAFLLSACLVLSIDWVSAAVALVLESVLFFFAGVSARTFFTRTLPVWIAAPLTAVTIALYGQTSGRVYLEFLFARVSDGSLELAIATLLRVLAIGLPAVVLFLTVDPTDLADGLAQVVRLPSRFVLGALAALRLVGLFLDDWKSLELARRARGVGDVLAVRPSPSWCSRSGAEASWLLPWKHGRSARRLPARGHANRGSVGVSGYSSRSADASAQPQ
jgi:energy-coupling factor transport system permease protein